MGSSGSTDISRRDFFNGLLIASGGLLVSQSFPIRYLLASMKHSSKNIPINLDSRALRGGNLPATFEVGHWLRDRRLSFSSHEIRLTPQDNHSGGTFLIHDSSEVYDVIISGSGISGLSTAFYILRRRPGTRILILDANSQIGG